jgi:hypothetical protein
VEVATADAVLVRDTTNREGVALSISPAVWATFTTSLK